MRVSMDARHMRLAKLRFQLDSLFVTGATTVHGSPEQQAVLELACSSVRTQWIPLPTL